VAHYRKIDTRIWNDEKFRSFTDNGKLAFFFLLTHPNMTAIGAMRATIPGLAAEIGWSAKGFGEAFREGASKGMARHDETACLVWLPNFIRYNPPENPNVLKAWVKSVEYLPECDLTTEAIQSVKAFAEGLGEAFAKALPEAFAKGMPIHRAISNEQEPKPIAPAAPGVEVPDWVPRPQWVAFVAMRKKGKSPFTDYAQKLALAELSRLRDEGHPPAALIDAAVLNGWKSFYPPKGPAPSADPPWKGAK
jgi:hypothetical protein